MKIDAECTHCQGTGLYRGYSEAKDEAVVCMTCEGTGCKPIEYQPFIGRKLRHDVKRVYTSRGQFIICSGKTGGHISYDQFLSGKFPKTP